MQCYISNELTHFAGRAKHAPEEKYDILKAILESGTLLASPRDGSGEPGRGWSRKGRLTLSSNQRYSTGLVCFCDIPVQDFPIHIRKYGPFGLAWHKDYMVARGASPVHYIAKSSIAATTPPLRRDQYFDEMVTLWEKYIFAKSQSPIMNNLQAFLKEEEKPRKLLPDEVERSLRVFQEAQAYFSLVNFIEHHIFCFIKFFDPSLPDAHPENYYMEREWRALGDVSFERSAITRIILPKEFGSRFRTDFPSYSGSVELV